MAALIAAQPPQMSRLVGLPLPSILFNNRGNRRSQLSISLVVSTYKASKVIFVGSEPQTTPLHSYFRNFYKPIGLAQQGPRLKASRLRTDVATKIKIHCRNRKNL